MLFGLVLILIVILVGCSSPNGTVEDVTILEEESATAVGTDGYGVYLSCNYDELPEDLHLDVLVINAQYYSEEEIADLQENNGAVYSYINLGSLEDFREYYDDYSSYCLDPYENWEGEYWVDVSEENWQGFITDVAQELADKGISGLFVDNVDVYYNYPTQEIFDGVVSILKNFKDLDLDVIINGGDVFVSKYLEENGTLTGVVDGVNQESVFSTIDWDTGEFIASQDDDREYFLDYLSNVKADGKEVYIIEYTNDSALIDTIKNQSEELGYHCYISDSIELD